MKQMEIMEEMSDGLTVSPSEKRELNRKAYGKVKGPQKAESSDPEGTELEKLGVTLYGTNGPIRLTPTEHKFVIGYVKKGSVKEAVEYTGYRGKNWSQLGYQMLNKPEVAEAISVMEKQHILAYGLS